MTNLVKLWLYPGANPAGTATSWESFSQDISAYIRRPGSDGGSPISYSWGKQDESTQTDASSMTLTLDNRDGRFSTDNVLGPWYGSLDINTPIRMGVVIGADSFARTVTGALGATAGWGGMTPAAGLSWTFGSAGAGSSTFSVDGSKGLISIPSNISALAIADGMACRDVDITSTIYPVQTASGASYAGGHAVRWTDNSNLDITTLEFNTAGDVSLKIRSFVAGVQTELASINPVPSSSYTAGVPWKLRTQAEGGIIRIKAWPAAGSEPAGWMLSAVEASNAGTGIGTFSWRFTSNTNTGNLVGYDDFTATAIEFTGYGYSWPLDWDQTGNNSWAKITAGGILRRLRQGTNPIVSPLTRQLTATADGVAYWSMEEGSDSVFFANVKAVGRPGTFSDVTPAGDTSLAGSSQAPTLNSDQGNIRLAVTPGLDSGGTGFSAMVLFKLSSLPAAKTRIITVSPRSGPVPTYAFSIDSVGNTTLEALQPDGTVISTVTNGPGVDFTEWTAWQLETDNTLSGGNTTATGIYHQVGAVDYFFQNFNVSGTTLSNIGGMTLSGPSGTAFSQAWLGQNTLPFVTNSFSRVSSGYAGETASARFTRVCGEAGIAVTIRGGGLLHSEAMGPQREAKTMDVLQACADVDYGVIAERGNGLEFIPKTARYNAALIYTLVKSAGEVGDIPKPVRDDQRLKNRWTVGRVNGSQATYQDDTSVARNGPWEDSATLNAYDDSALASAASWRTFIGTSLRLRWPDITMNFARSPQLMKVWRQRYYGWRIGITTGLVQTNGNEPDVIMEGFQATLDPDVWLVEMNCTDARTWNVGVWDTNRWGAIYTTLGSAITTTGTTIVLSSSNSQEQWAVGASTAHVYIGGGEEVALGTIGAVTGTGPWTQTVTGCTRSVNGVVKSHGGGEVITVKDALRWAL